MCLDGADTTRSATPTWVSNDRPIVPYSRDDTVQRTKAWSCLPPDERLAARLIASVEPDLGSRGPYDTGQQTS